MTEFAGFLRSREKVFGIMTVFAYSDFMNLPGITRPIGAAPGSLADNANRRTGGVPACVIRLRFCGVYLPRRYIRERAMPTGLLISKEYDDGKWGLTLHPMDGALTPILDGLSSPAVVKRRADGAMLIEGLEWDEGRLDRWRQTWLCAPTMPLAESALDAMATWLEAQYNRAQFERMHRER